MADLPDFTLPFSQFMGDLHLDYDSVTATAFTSDIEIFSITGKGQIVVGHIRFSGGSGIHNNEIYIEIDGVMSYYDTFNILNNYGITKVDVNTLHLTCFNLVNYRIAIALARFITFEESLKIIYDNNSATDNLVRYRVFSSLLHP